MSFTDKDGMTPEEQRVINAAVRLSAVGSLIYDRPRGDDTPIPTCAGCSASSWGEIKHYPNCTVLELIAAVKMLRTGAQGASA